MNLRILGVEDCMKNGNVQDLVRLLIQRRKGVNQKTRDKHKRTALHLATISELPSVVKILVEHSATDVAIIDADRKMAIHYAAENCMKTYFPPIKNFKSTIILNYLVLQIFNLPAIRPRSHECFKILSDWSLIQKNMPKDNLEAQDSFRKYLLWETCQHEGTTLVCNAMGCRSAIFMLPF